MISNRIAFTVEQFVLRDNPASTLGQEILVGGWFHSDQDVVRSELLLDGNATPHFSMAAVAEPSPDVAAVHGPAAISRRFTLLGPVTPMAIPFSSATLCFTLRNGDRCAIEIARLFRSTITVQKPGHAELLSGFESLGENPEFGHLQRLLGIERPGLFRNAECHSIQKLAAAIQGRFSGFATAETLQLSTRDGQWLAADTRTGYVSHTGIPTAGMSAAQICEQEAARLPFLARMFLGDLVAGDKIYVRCADGDDAEADMLDLFQALRRIGPARLLWVAPANARCPANTVVKVSDGLYRGGIARLAPAAAPAEVPVAQWTALLTEALKVIVAPAPSPLLPVHDRPHPAGAAPTGAWALAEAGPAVSEAARRPGWRRLLGGAA